MVEHKEKDSGREGKMKVKGEHGGRIGKGMKGKFKGIMLLT